MLLLPPPAVAAKAVGLAADQAVSRLSDQQAASIGAAAGEVAGRLSAAPPASPEVKPVVAGVEFNFSPQSPSPGSDDGRSPNFSSLGERASSQCCVSV